jgi:hypothetical protein
MNSKEDIIKTFNLRSQRMLEKNFKYLKKMDKL